MIDTLQKILIFRFSRLIRKSRRLGNGGNKAVHAILAIFLEHQILFPSPFLRQLFSLVCKLSLVQSFVCAVKMMGLSISEPLILMTLLNNCSEAKTCLSFYSYIFDVRN